MSQQNGGIGRDKKCVWSDICCACNTLCGSTLCDNCGDYTGEKWEPPLEQYKLEYRAEWFGYYERELTNYE